jgi:hypothetical protein
MKIFPLSPKMYATLVFLYIAFLNLLVIINMPSLFPTVLIALAMQVTAYFLAKDVYIKVSLNSATA